MADLNVVLMFCALYSGVVVASLWITVARGPGALQKKSIQAAHGQPRAESYSVGTLPGRYSSEQNSA